MLHALVHLLIAVGALACSIREEETHRLQVRPTPRINSKLDFTSLLDISTSDSCIREHTKPPSFADLVETHFRELHWKLFFDLKGTTQVWFGYNVNLDVKANCHLGKGDKSEHKCHLKWAKFLFG